jgi:nucleotidyltransferase substrate binding protein (TIGR01987 family)
MPSNSDIRWKQRFQSFDRGLILLREALEEGIGELNQLEKEGVIQRFEYCFELAWKTVKDYLEYSGIVIREPSPRRVIKEAFAAGIIADGQVWIAMLDHRNLLSHTYDLAVFEQAAEALAARYALAIESLHAFFITQMAE